MAVFTKTAQEVFAPTTSGGAPRGADMAEAQTWGTEAESAIESAEIGRIDQVTWAELSAITGSAVGQPAQVLGPDASTHTDPVVGGSVSNVGSYIWSASPAGWRRVGGLSSAAEAAASAEADADRAEAARDAALASVPAVRVASVTALKARDPDAAGYVTIRTDTLHGDFFFDTSQDWSALADDLEIIGTDGLNGYASDGSEGAWIRQRGRSQNSPDLNIAHNGDMELSRRYGHTSGAGEVMVLSTPFRVGNDTSNITPTYRTKPDGGRVSLMTTQFHPVDRWGVDISDGTGFCEHVGVDNPDEWASSTAYSAFDLVAAPSGGFGGGYGSIPYTYKSLKAQTSTASWDTDAKNALDDASFEQRPELWGIYGVKSSYAAMKNRKALRWAQRVAATGTAKLSQMHYGFNVVEGGGVFTVSADFVNLEAAAAAMTVTLKVYARRGDGTSVAIYSTAPTASVTTSGARLYWHIKLVDPYAGSGGLLNKGSSNYLKGNKEAIIFEWEFPTSRTWDVLISMVDIRRGYWPAIEYAPKSENQERQDSEGYLYKENEDFLPIRCAAFINDASSGVAQYNTIAHNDIYTRYGIMDAAVIDWGGTDRAFKRNEHEQPNRGQTVTTIYVEAKGKPKPQKTQGMRLVTKPQESAVKVYSTVDASEGFGDLNTRRQAALKFDYTGAGASDRVYSRRSLVEIQIFGVTQSSIQTNCAFRDPNTTGSPYAAYENFSTTRVIGSGQDDLGSSFPQLHLGTTYAWDWFASGSGTDVYYLAIADGSHTDLSISASLTAGTPYHVPGSRIYVECVTAHTCDTTSSAVLTDPRFRPFGQVEMPHRLLMDGSTVLDDENLADPASMTAGQWAFTDDDGLGFQTIYCRMASGAADPGSAADRLKALSYSNQPSLQDEVLFQVSAGVDRYD